MPENNETGLAKAAVFFDRARKIARTNNFDYAIEMYLEGLRCAPDEVEQGHMPLHNLALLRQSRGGKKPSVIEKVRHLRARAPLELMLNAEYLFAKDPEHLPYAEAILKAAVTGTYNKAAKWIADFIFEANKAASKPSLQIYLLLKDSYAAIGQYNRAIAACQCAMQLRPEDGDLVDEFRSLSAQSTLASGKYDQAGDFRESIKDREAQEKLQAQASVVKTSDYLLAAVEEAREEFARNPNLAMNIFNLAEVLSALEDDKADNEAIGLLENAFEARNDFSFKEQAGKIRIKQLKRKLADAQACLDAKPDDLQAQAQVADLSAQLNNTELDHYHLCEENYPTNLRAKYEYGACLLRNKQYDEAIPLFQDARRDPRRKVASMDKIGVCFYEKGWYDDAIDIFNQATGSYEIKDDGIAKELRYNLARAYEKKGDAKKALEIYRKIAQLDFSYKDVHERVDKLRDTTTKN